MKRAFAQRIARLCLAPAILLLVAGTGTANAQTTAPKEAPATLNAVDFNFVGQANLGGTSRTVWQRRSIGRQGRISGTNSVRTAKVVVLNEPNFA
jgi:hypothetical protein